MGVFLQSCHELINFLLFFKKGSHLSLEHITCICLVSDLLLVLLLFTEINNILPYLNTPGSAVVWLCPASRSVSQPFLSLRVVPPEMVQHISEGSQKLLPPSGKRYVLSLFFSSAMVGSVYTRQVQLAVSHTW